MDYSIKDSSIWENNEAIHLLYDKDCAIRMGVIREEMYVEDFGQTRYGVEVWDSGRIVMLTCLRVSRFGGIYNYEEYSNRGYDLGELASTHKTQPGDHVIVAYANGDSREGYILGYLNHSGRKEVINHEDDEKPSELNEFLNREGTSTIAYSSEFNGIERVINKAGEYRVTFRGIQTNIDMLLEAPAGDELALPEYDIEVGSSYYEFDMTGSYLLTDNTEEDPQSIFLNKTDGEIVITSGKTILTINKEEESYNIVNKKTTITSEDEVNIVTKSTNILSSELVSIEASEVTITGDLAQSGDVSITGDTEITGKTDITGAFSTTGETKLAGGANPLIYEIILITGTGNLGLPVISTATVLKTVQTKAT